MIILVDCDGIICDLVSALCERLSRFGFPRTPEDFTRYAFQETLTPVEMQIATDWMSAHGTAQSLPAYAGAAEFLTTLRAKGEVFAVTAPWKSRTWADDRTYWLSQYGFTRERVLSVPSTAKILVRGDVLIEDTYTTSRDWALANPEGKSLLLDRPWNRQSDDGVIRCANYAEIVEQIK